MNREDLWKEATQDGIVLKGDKHKYAIHNGVKIERYDNGLIVLYTTMRGGEFYKKLTDQEMIPFFSHGFFMASLMLAIKNAEDHISVYESGQGSKKASTWREIKENYEKKLKSKYGS